MPIVTKKSGWEAGQKELKAYVSPRMYKSFMVECAKQGRSMADVLRVVAQAFVKLDSRIDELLQDYDPDKATAE